MVKKLIVNADDYGRTNAVSLGIRAAHLEGIVSTSTAMMNLPAATEAVRIAKEKTANLDLGVHLNLTFGEPLSPQVKQSSLTDSQGKFREKDFFFHHPQEFVTSDVEREWRAQIESFLACDIVLDHLDSHHHVALASADLWALLLELAKEYDCGVRLPNPMDVTEKVLHATLPTRCIDFVRREAVRSLEEADIPHPDYFFAGFFASGANLDNISHILHSLPDGVSELMCHPGFVDRELCATSGYTDLREREFQILTNPNVKQTIAETGIVLTTFRRAWV